MPSETQTAEDMARKIIQDCGVSDFYKKMERRIVTELESYAAQKVDEAYERAAKAADSWMDQPEYISREIRKLKSGGSK